LDRRREEHRLTLTGITKRRSAFGNCGGGPMTTTPPKTVHMAVYDGFVDWETWFATAS
jgi:hypothetical protein